MHRGQIGVIAGSDFSRTSWLADVPGLSYLWNSPAFSCRLFAGDESECLSRPQLPVTDQGTLHDHSRSATRGTRRRSQRLSCRMEYTNRTVALTRANRRLHCCVPTNIQLRQCRRLSV